MSGAGWPELPCGLVVNVHTRYAGHVGPAIDLCDEQISVPRISAMALVLVLDERIRVATDDDAHVTDAFDDDALGAIAGWYDDGQGHSLRSALRLTSFALAEARVEGKARVDAATVAHAVLNLV